MAYSLPHLRCILLMKSEDIKPHRRYRGFRSFVRVAKPALSEPMITAIRFRYPGSENLDNALIDNSELLWEVSFATQEAPRPLLYANSDLSRWAWRALTQEIFHDPSNYNHGFFHGDPAFGRPTLGDRDRIIKLANKFLKPHLSGFKHIEPMMTRKQCKQYRALKNLVRDIGKPPD